jgi:hypothetical protein
LQIEHYLTLALEQAYRFGEKPVLASLELNRFVFRCIKCG